MNHEKAMIEAAHQQRLSGREVPKKDHYLNHDPGRCHGCPPLKSGMYNVLFDAFKAGVIANLAYDSADAAFKWAFEEWLRSVEDDA